jgi:hypothetical protein
MKSPARIGVRNGLHQFADLGFQIFVTTISARMVDRMSPPHVAMT